MKKNVLHFFLISLVLASCTTTKTSWIQKPESQKLQVAEQLVKNNPQPAQISPQNKIQHKADIKQADVITSNPFKVSSEFTGKSLVTPSLKDKENLFHKEKQIISLSKTGDVSGQQSTSISNKKKITVPTQASTIRDDGSGVRALGWVVLIGGIIVLLAASIIVGILVMVLGLVLIIAGRKPAEPEKQQQSPYIDVVYLKNGSMIRGQIIEQIPNVSIKIQTKDGSIFVYKMEEIDKIRKEVAK